MENTFLQVHQKKVLESQRNRSCLFVPVFGVDDATSLRYASAREFHKGNKVLIYVPHRCSHLDYIL